MKNKTLTLVIIVLLLCSGISFTLTANNSGQEDKADCCCCCLTCCKMVGMKGCEDIEVNVENIKDGVIVKVTSQKVDVVKKVQEMCAKMKEMCVQAECCVKEPKKEKINK